MPNVDKHCKISMERTRASFRELHEWIDESSKYLNENHRIERHSYHDVYRKYIQERWGEKAVIEWLFHIAVDNLHTAYKESLSQYGENRYDHHEFIFSNGELEKYVFR